MSKDVYPKGLKLTYGFPQGNGCLVGWMSHDDYCTTCKKLAISIAAKPLYNRGTVVALEITLRPCGCAHIVELSRDA